MTRTTTIALVGGQETHLNLGMIFGETQVYEVDGHEASTLRMTISSAPNTVPEIEVTGTGSVTIPVDGLALVFEGTTRNYNIWKILDGGGEERLFYGAIKIRPSISPFYVVSPTLTAYGAYKDQAEAARDLAQKWASEDEDTVVAGGLFSALHYAAKAAASAGTATAVLDDAGFVAVAGDLLGADTIGTVAGIASAVVSVADIEGNVTTVAGIADDVTTVAGISANVTTVAGIAPDVTTTAGVAGHIPTVAGASVAITTVAGSIANVNVVAARDTDIGTLAPIAANISTVAGSHAAVVTVAGIDDSVTTVAAVADHVPTLAALDTEVAALGPVSANITIVAGIKSDVVTVAGIAPDVTAVADNMAAVQDAADDLNDINIAMLQMATAYTNSQTRYLALTVPA